MGVASGIDKRMALDVSDLKPRFLRTGRTQNADSPQGKTHAGAIFWRTQKTRTAVHWEGLLHCMWNMRVSLFAERSIATYLHKSEKERAVQNVVLSPDKGYGSGKKIERLHAKCLFRGRHSEAGEVSFP